MLKITEMWGSKKEFVIKGDYPSIRDYITARYFPYNLATEFDLDMPFDTYSKVIDEICSDFTYSLEDLEEKDNIEWNYFYGFSDISTRYRMTIIECI